MHQTALGNVQLGTFSAACINYSVSLFISFTCIERKWLLLLQCPIVPGAVNTHLQAGSLTPEVYPEMWDRKDGGGEWNLSTWYYSMCVCISSRPGTGAFFQVRKVEPYDITMLGISVLLSFQRESDQHFSLKSGTAWACVLWDKLGLCCRINLGTYNTCRINLDAL